MALIAQYLFNGNSNDETGTYNGIPANVTYENAPVGYRFGPGVAVFNGSSSKIDLPNITPISGTAARSIEFWEYRSSLTTRGEVFTYGSGNAGAGFVLAIPAFRNSIAELTFVTMGDAGSFGTATTGWHHIVLTFPAGGKTSSAKLYVDGVSQSFTLFEGTDIFLNTDNIYYSIGYRARANNNFFNGKLGNFRIYDNELTATDVANHYNAEKSLPTLVAQYLFQNNANNAVSTSYNGTATAVFYEDAPTGMSIPGKVAVFNGTSSKIDLPNIGAISGQSARTIEWWQYSNVNDQTLQFAWSQGDGAGTGTEFSLALVSEPTWNKPIAAVAGVIAEFGQTTPIGSWHHHAFVLPAHGKTNQVQYYLDGVLQTNHSTDTTTLSTTNNNYAIGYRRRSNAFYLNGKLANFRIWSDALDQATIQSHYNAESSNSGMIAQYLFNYNCNSETGNFNGTPSNIYYLEQPTGYHFGSKVAAFDGWTNSSRSSISFPFLDWRADWTVETWYRRPYTGKKDLFLHAGTSYSNYQMLHLGVNQNNTLKEGFWGNDLDTPGSFSDSNWHHLAFSYDVSTKVRQIWCDGVMVATDTASSALNSSTTWYVGWYDTNENFTGYLANLRIYNKVLDTTTVQNHYNAEKADIPVSSFNYTGDVQSFTAPTSGYYKLETWGAAAGGSTSYVGGFGGYSVGVVHLQKDAVLHIGVGQLGTSVTTTRTTASATFNGGGTARTSEFSGSVAGAGGGATHIATASGELKDLVSNQSSVLIVSGGGGGGHFLNSVNYGQGGQGGGFNGAGGTGYASDNNSDPRRRSGGGTQTAGGTTANGDLPGGFGYGGNGTDSVNGIGSGGGGGWYGGSGCLNGPGGGGSGYIGSNNLISYGGVTKHMTGYNVTTSSNPDTLTYSNSNAHYVPLVDNEMRAGGFVQITLIEEIVSDFNTAALLLMMV